MSCIGLKTKNDQYCGLLCGQEVSFSVMIQCVIKIKLLIFYLVKIQFSGTLPCDVARKGTTLSGIVAEDFDVAVQAWWP